MQAIHIHHGFTQFAGGQGVALFIHQFDGCQHTQGFTHIAGHGLVGETGVLHPVKAPDIPQKRQAGRGVGGAIVGRHIHVVTEHHIGDAADSINAAAAFLHRVVFGIAGALHEVLHMVGEGPHLSFQLLPLRLVMAGNTGGKAVPLHGIEQGFEHRGPQGGNEFSPFGIGEALYRLAPIHPQGSTLVVQLAGMAGGATDIQAFLAGAGVHMAPQSHGQVTRVQGIGLLSRGDDESPAPHIVIGGQPFVG